MSLMLADRNDWVTDWHFPRVLTAPVIDDWVASLPPSTKKVNLRLGQWQRTGPFADARLQGALCLLHRKNIVTAAVVPPGTFAGDRADVAFSEHDPLRPTRLTETERKLAGSLAGLIIGQLCTLDAKHRHITSRQAELLVGQRYLFGRGDHAALVVPADAAPTGQPRKPAVVREAFFNNRLYDLLPPLGIGARKTRLGSVHWFHQLRSFAFEASENTWDHGRLDFANRPIRALRFVRFRRIDIGREGFDIEDAAPGFAQPFRRYLESLNAAKDLPFVWDREGGRLIEVTIADGGVGIAGRMAGNLEVFNEPLARETEFFLRALLPGGSTKSASAPGRGQGFRKMLRACFQLSGFIVVRTGRLRALRTYRRADGSNESVDFDSTRSNTYVPDVNRAPLPLLGGTSVSLIFPIEPVRARRATQQR